MQTTDVVTARAIKTTAKGLVLILADKQVSIPWSKCPRTISHASPRARNKAELSPGGYGIHWPLLDEDLSVGGLLRLAEK